MYQLSIQPFQVFSPAESPSRISFTISTLILPFVHLKGGKSLINQGTQPHSIVRSTYEEKKHVQKIESRKTILRKERKKQKERILSCQLLDSAGSVLCRPKSLSNSVHLWSWCPVNFAPALIQYVNKLLPRQLSSALYLVMRGSKGQLNKVWARHLPVLDPNGPPVSGSQLFKTFK